MQGDETQQGAGQGGRMQQGQQAEQAEQGAGAYGKISGSRPMEGAQEREEEAPCDWRAPVGDGELAQAENQPHPEAVQAAKEKESCDPPADWRSPGG